MAGNVRLKPEDEAGIDRMIASGRYPDREAVVAEGLRLVRERDQWLTMIEAKVMEARADVAAGRVRDADEVLDELTERYRNWPK